MTDRTAQRMSKRPLFDHIHSQSLFVASSLNFAEQSLAILQRVDGEIAWSESLGPVVSIPTNFVKSRRT